MMEGDSDGGSQSDDEIHGGEFKINLDGMSKNSKRIDSISSQGKFPSSKDKIIKKINRETNALDKVVNSTVSHANDTVLQSTSMGAQANGVIKPTPVTYCNILKSKNKLKVQHEGRIVLLDSGSSHSMVNAAAVQHLRWKKLRMPESFSSCSGDFEMSHRAEVVMTFPELNGHRVVTWQCYVDEREGDELGYDMIIGRDLMTALGIVLDFKNKTVEWEGAELEMRDFDSEKPTRKEIKAALQVTSEPTVTQQETSRLTKILDATYGKADLYQVSQNATHLNEVQQKELYELLKKYESIFDGKLSQWDTEPVEFEFQEDAKPHSHRHFPIPHIHKETFKKEILRLVEIGVLEQVEGSEWGSPTFIIPKKDGKVRFVSDFRILNKKIKRKPYPLPRIAELLQDMSGFSYATALDLSMGYYAIRLSPRSSDACTIVTEFGKFKYNRLPMGVSCAPDIFQSKINELLGDIEGICAYIDDLLLLSKGSWTDHLERLEEVLKRLKEKNLKVNPLKSFFGIGEVEYLGYMISREGIKPQPKKVKAILSMQRPTTTTEVRRLVGMVNYYRDVWRGRSHILGPLTELASGKKNKKIVWNDECERAFQDIKKLVAQETILAYPDWSKPFEVHSDASDYQLGAILSQDGKPLSFFSRKLTAPQKNYTTTEKELLAVVEGLKHFKNIIYGYPVKVYSDHKNLVHKATVSESQRVMRWRMILEEYNPEIIHIKGEENIAADALSRLPKNEEVMTPKNNQNHELFAQEISVDLDAYPLEYASIAEEQKKEIEASDKIKKLLKDKTSGYYKTDLEGHEIMMYKKCIYVPKALRGRLIRWYHHFLCHPGATRLTKTLQQICYWEGMTYQCEQYCKRCKICQMNKKRKTKYGHLPPKEVGELKPWERVHVDLIGPYTKTVKQIQPGLDKPKKVDLELIAMTFIDPATGWFEIAEVPAKDKSSARISNLFDDVWLARYPRPKEVIFDNGSEFKKDFLPLLKDFAIKPKPTTVKNPQSNAVVERVHQVVGNMIRTQELDNRVFDYINPWGPILTSVAWAIRSSYHTTLEATPAQLVFGRDMAVNLQHMADWHSISTRKQSQVDRDNVRENSKRISHDYRPGEEVLLIKDGHFRKLDEKYQGPFTITDVYVNGTVRIQKNLHVTERVNIRRITPFWR